MSPRKRRELLARRVPALEVAHVGVFLFSVPKVTVDPCPESKHWRGSWVVKVARS